ncbi:MAG: hypothetical protein WC371_02455 [Parachlamydiales bacterium]|jgi:hypothetical protein
MLSPTKIEELYQEFAGNLKDWAHDGLISVDLKLLHELNLLGALSSEQDENDDFSQYFHVIETPEKVTLFNEQFIIWIVPKMEEENPVTYVYIALSHEDKASLEIVFTTSGVYNTPKFVLRVLQYYLLDMIETEATLTNFKKET